MFIYHSENPRVLKNYANSVLPVLYKCKQQSLDARTSVYNVVFEYFKPTVEIYFSAKTFLSKYYCSLTIYPWSSKSFNGDVQDSYHIQV